MSIKDETKQKSHLKRYDGQSMAEKIANISGLSLDVVTTIFAKIKAENKH